MIDRDDESEIGRGDSEGARYENPRRGIVWISVAFGILVAGLVAGTILFAWRSPWAGVVPLAAFVGYILAFRRGLVLWNPSLDRSWRHYLWLERGNARDDRGEDDRRDPPGDIRVISTNTPRPPRHEMRVVR